MTKKPIDHFSLTALRKSINEHPSLLFTLTKAEMEGMVGRLEKVRDCLADYFAELEESCPDALEYSEELNQWLASLEREG